jgi:group I intron endonuclease
MNSYITKDQGLYMIWSNVKPDCYYIGSSNNIRRRYNEHISYFKRNKHSNTKLQNHVNKYGIDDLNFCVHVIDNSLSNKELRKLEQKEILYFNTFKKGFNLTENTEHAVMSDEGRLRVSLKAKERQSTKEAKEKLVIQNSGERNPNSKLTNKDVLFIRNNLDLKRKELSLLYNISYKTIWRIRNNKTYK